MLRHKMRRLGMQKLATQEIKMSKREIHKMRRLGMQKLATPHYLSLHLLKFPDIVKLNTCMLFYDYFYQEKVPNIPVSLVSELHNYNTRSCLLYTSPSPRDLSTSRMPSSA